jgi:quercetin dioxygenase-like cupin family protein
MHKTDTVDYAIVISGEIYAVMEKGEVLLHPGDSLIQRGTNHAWSNRTEQPCVVAFVMVSAKPVE